MTVCVAAGLLLTSGCAGWKWPRAADDEAPAATTQPDKPAEPPRTREQLEKDVATLRAEKTVLEGRLAEFTARQNALAGRMRDLQFIKDQQDRQIEALKDAAKTRDTYKKQIDELTLEVVRLKGLLGTSTGKKPAPAPPPEK